MTGALTPDGSMADFEQQFTSEEQLGGELAGLAMQWAELGIDADDFVKCGACHEYKFDEDGRARACACERAAKGV